MEFVDLDCVPRRTKSTGRKLGEIGRTALLLVGSAVTTGVIIEEHNQIVALQEAQRILTASAVASDEAQEAQWYLACLEGKRTNLVAPLTDCDEFSDTMMRVKRVRTLELLEQP